ncbi:Glyoxalase/bleomycin resistance protein/dioxygenase [Beutenbergia cavernae DSM 12333]|uniref:Glyoxalase/bleomycin resistance protein/dioxygenase n=1 Tax=Beutenbergia cavernae (strain ATCC BAA-8 / DSM 12333 / CCUG 43141 / JCM 11478 / NBRC 16432 / NCIMB 13614 / HKI 0122) TaxID=471853 RepID=C5C6L8_BEUC1|nr:VOC family protein [Beutenbergia cavernae]ACQ82442.1 Glyoxalase/bleomycin resistance protein/dioxygenase [Beutenbergia cavernae DSM 12333]
MTEKSARRWIDYVELTVTDLPAAIAFYERAFGWEFTSYGEGYAGIRGATSDDPEVGGLSLGDSVRPGGPFLLFSSDDLDASVVAVTDAGGAVVQGPYSFPGGRRFHFTDPSGNELGVYQDD